MPATGSNTAPIPVVPGHAALVLEPPPTCYASSYGRSYPPREGSLPQFLLLDGSAAREERPRRIVAAAEAAGGVQSMSTHTFPDLGVSTAVAEALSRRGFTEPFPIQTLVMRDAMAGRDVLARSRTGSGKTLAFAVPIVERLARDGARPSALILVPTRELASQVVEEFEGIAQARGLRVAAAYGGISIHEQGREVSRADILVATPGRLEDLATRGLVKLGQVKILILDEADRMLDMGFQPQVDKLVRRIPKDRQTMFFSATLDGEVGRLASAYTRDPVRHEVEAPRQTVEEAEHRFVPVTTADKLETLAGLLRAEPGLALVFVRTKRGADRLAARLKDKGIAAAAMHGDLSQAQRERALARFE